MSNSDLTTQDGVKATMESAASEADWNAKCDQVKAANGGYPSFWYELIIASGLVNSVRGRW